MIGLGKMRGKYRFFSSELRASIDRLSLECCFPKKNSKTKFSFNLIQIQPILFAELKGMSLKLAIAFNLKLIRLLVC